MMIIFYRYKGDEHDDDDDDDEEDDKNTTTRTTTIKLSYRIDIDRHHRRYIHTSETELDFLLFTYDQHVVEIVLCNGRPTSVWV